MAPPPLPSIIPPGYSRSGKLKVADEIGHFVRVLLDLLEARDLLQLDEGVYEREGLEGGVRRVGQAVEDRRGLPGREAEEEGVG